MASKLVWNQTGLEKEVQAEMKSRLKEAAEVVRNAARNNVLQSDKAHEYRGRIYPPGSLKKSISYRVGYWKRPTTVSGEQNIDYKDNLIARIGTSLLYGVFQEIGPVKETKLYRNREVSKIRSSSKKGRRWVYQSKSTVNRWKFKPWLRPAFHQTESEVKRILGVGGNILLKTKGTGDKFKPSDVLLEDKFTV